MYDFFELLFHTFNNASDWIKFVWIASTTCFAISALWLAFRYDLYRRELNNERLKIKTDRQTILDEQAQLTKAMELHARIEQARDKVPSHIDRQENYLPGHDIKNFEDWLIEKRQSGEALAEEVNSDHDDHELDEGKLTAAHPPLNGNNKQSV